MRRLSLALCALVALAGCSGAASSPAPQPTTAASTVPVFSPLPTATPETTPALTPTLTPKSTPASTPASTPLPGSDTRRTADIERHIAGMTTQEKVASLFWVQPEQLSGTTTVFTDDTASYLERYPVSGVVLFDTNVRDKTQTRALTAAFSQAGGAGFVVAVDEEGGRVSRLGGVSGFPKTPAMGTLGDGAEVYDLLRPVGEHLHDWGFNLNLAPVCDVPPRLDGGVIGDRAFSTDAATAATLVPQAVLALRDGGVAVCLKHFPGHGAASGDSHNDVVSVSKSLSQLQTEDWAPFAAGIAEGAELVMVGHIALPQAAGDDTPGSLSHVIVTDFLRGMLGFDGLVVTDSMRMGAIISRLDAGEAAVRAVLAGCDVILMPDDLPQAIAGVSEAVRSGRIPMARLDEAVRRRLEVFF